MSTSESNDGKNFTDYKQNLIKLHKYVVAQIDEIPSFINTLSDVDKDTFSTEITGINNIKTELDNIDIESVVRFEAVETPRQINGYGIFQKSIDTAIDIETQISGNIEKCLALLNEMKKKLANDSLDTLITDITTLNDNVKKIIESPTLGQNASDNIKAKLDKSNDINTFVPPQVSPPVSPRLAPATTPSTPAPVTTPPSGSPSITTNVAVAPPGPPSTPPPEFNINIFYTGLGTKDDIVKNISIMSTTPTPSTIVTDVNELLLCNNSINVLTISMPFQIQSTVSLMYTNVFYQCLIKHEATVDNSNAITLKREPEKIMDLLKEITTASTDIYYNSSVNKQQFVNYQTKIDADFKKIQDEISGTTVNKEWLPNIVINSVRDSIAVISMFEHACLKTYKDLAESIKTNIQFTKVSPEIQKRRDTINDLFTLRGYLFSAAVEAASLSDKKAAETKAENAKKVLKDVFSKIMNSLNGLSGSMSGGKTNTTRKSKLRRRKSERRKKPKKNV